MKSLLLIAYFYPPVGSTGIPGVQRAKRFLRYLGIPELHVLTMAPQCYPSYLGTESDDPQPINGEKVHRTGVIDILDAATRVRNAWRGMRGGLKAPTDCMAPTTLRQTQGSSGNRWSSLKDMATDMITYPDFANPWLAPALIRGARIIRENKIEAVLATGMPWTSLIIGYWLKILTGAKLVVDFRDPWVGNPFHNKNRLIRYLDRRCESCVINEANLVIANTESLRKEMALRYPNAAQKLFVLSNGYDDQDFSQIQPAARPAGGFVITHAGLLYSKRDPLCFLNALELLKKEQPKIADQVNFLHIGGIDSDLGYNVKDLCESKGISQNVTFLDYVKHEECLAHLAASDALLVIQPGTRTQVPSKLYEYIYLEKPILTIAETNGALAALISENGFGSAFEPGDSRQISQYLADLVVKKQKGVSAKPDYRQKAKFDARQIVSELRLRMESL